MGDVCPDVTLKRKGSLCSSLRVVRGFLMLVQVWDSLGCCFEASSGPNPHPHPKTGSLNTLELAK